MITFSHNTGKDILDFILAFLFLFYNIFRQIKHLSFLDFLSRYADLCSSGYLIFYWRQLHKFDLFNSPKTNLHIGKP